MPVCILSGMFRPPLTQFGTWLLDGGYYWNITFLSSQDDFDGFVYMDRVVGEDCQSCLGGPSWCK